MSTAGLQVPSKAELWQAYSDAFHEFARSVEELESLKTIGTVDQASVDRALLALERARGHYHQSRDALALALLSGRPSNLAETQVSTGPPDDSQRVRAIAQLLWEFEARREGFAEDDWYHAEEIIRNAREGDALSAFGAALS
jgi:hypothetical protein